LSGPIPREDGADGATEQVFRELRERAVRMVFERTDVHTSQWATIRTNHVAALFGVVVRPHAQGVEGEQPHRAPQGAPHMTRPHSATGTTRIVRTRVVMTGLPPWTNSSGQPTLMQRILSELPARELPARRAAVNSGKKGPPRTTHRVAVRRARLEHRDLANQPA